MYERFDSLDNDSDIDPLDEYMKQVDDDKKKDDQLWEKKTSKYRDQYNQRWNSMSMKTQFESQLEENLSTPLSKSGIGFKLLQKMGFKEGEGLGKDGNGIVEPIKIQYKNDNLGIGLEKPKVSLVRIKQKEIEREKVFQKKRQTYQEYVHDKYEMKSYMKDIRSARRVCQTLDEQHDKEQNKYWPIENKEEEESFECISDIKSYLVKILMYLRQTYHYCFYCGIEFSSEEDMKNNCPGISKEDHS
ncbi:hypothetical protein WA158_006728 [Blastocystis sp. Blastoise]